MTWEDYAFVSTIYFGLALAIIEIVFAFHFALTNKTWISIGLGTITIVLNGLGAYMMIAMILGAWPTAIPHLAIILSTFILIGMYAIARKQTRPR